MYYLYFNPERFDSVFSLLLRLGGCQPFAFGTHCVKIKVSSFFVWFWLPHFSVAKHFFQRQSFMLDIATQQVILSYPTQTNCDNG